MKIIDEKGKLFGKINVIDFLVLLFLLCLSPMFYFGYKIFNKKPPQNTPAPVIEIPKTFIETELNFILNKLEPETAGLIVKGDREVNEKGEVVAEIVSLGKAIPVAYEIDLGNQQKLIKEDPVLRKIPALLKIKAEFKDNVLYYKGKPIKINSVIDFVTAKYKLEALYPPITGAAGTLESGDKIKDLIMPLEQKISLLNQEIGILKERIRMIESSLRKETGRKK